MDRRTFIERLSASMVGAMAAAKVTCINQNVNALDRAAEATPEVTVKEFTEYIPKLNYPQIVGIAMEPAEKEGDVIAVLVCNDYMRSHQVTRVVAAQPIDRGAFVGADGKGFVYTVSHTRT